MPEYIKVKLCSFKERFAFLSALDDKRNLRHALYAPDLLDPDWTVFDVSAKRTLGKGQTAAAAVDTAIHNAAK